MPGTIKAVRSSLKFFDIGVPSLRYFDEEVKKYSYMWREGGQFSTEKYSSKNNLEGKPN